MLKKKLQSLVSKGNFDQLSNFEIIYDAAAMQIMGGEEPCPNLTSCSSYRGPCSALTTCGTYSAV